jgi:hypothetical protein
MQLAHNRLVGPDATVIHRAHRAWKRTSMPLNLDTVVSTEKLEKKDAGILQKPICDDGLRQKSKAES